MRQIEDFINVLDGRAGMYTMGQTFGEVCAFLDGFDACSELRMMKGFQSWLAGRTKGKSELTWWALVLSEFGDEVRVADVRRFSAGENEQAIEHLFRLFREYLDDNSRRRDGTRNGLV
ncbi:hypothetical protein OG735_16480 [Streptomyces sp. NBC_01210]|uniref:hypothetical protein n=1 Tax=Streptomyces sp. NBC_01210 TaxID=2903774 RepID=UPI002E0FF856|nr:hypothetical protein OG735_16480 [Streptomyces sp. NBC_01210]